MITREEITLERLRRLLPKLHALVARSCPLVVLGPRRYQVRLPSGRIVSTPNKGHAAALVRDAYPDVSALLSDRVADHAREILALFGLDRNGRLITT